MIKVEQNKQNSFFFEIKPNRSLYGTQRVIFFTLLFSTCLIIGLAFFMLGATLILPFAGLEIMLLFIILRFNRNWLNQSEKIYLDKLYVKLEKGKNDITFKAYYGYVFNIFAKNAYMFGDTETIYHIEMRKFVDRDSYDGEEAEEIQCSRRFRDFFKKEKLSQYYRPPPKKEKINFKPVPSLAERLKKNKV